jgi:hypothetical protein
LISADQFRARFADGFLFGKLMRIARGKSKFIRFRRHNPRAAVRAPQISRCFQRR